MTAQPLSAPPLAGLRVVDLGHYIAGPLAGVLLADQGAEVIAVEPQGGARWRHSAAAVLRRGKRVVRADLRESPVRERLLQLLDEADVLIDNFRPGVLERLGLGCEQLRERNPALVHVSLPGFGAGDARRSWRAWEGIVAAACGLFTDLAVTAHLEPPPIYTPLPLASVYGGVHAATAALAAVYARGRHGRGERIEVPLLDAAMSAAAGYVTDIEDQPARYNEPPLEERWLRTARAGVRRLPDRAARALLARSEFILPALFCNYRCADGRQLFLCAIDHEGQISGLADTLNVRRDMHRLGFRFGDCLDVPPTRDNVCAYRGTTPRWLALRALLGRRFATRPAADWEVMLTEAGVPAAVQRSTAEWLDLEPMLVSGVVVDVALPGRGAVRQPGPQVDVIGTGAETSSPAPERTGALEDGWSAPRRFTPPGQAAVEPSDEPPLSGLRVLDLSTVIAGPAASRTLAELGAEVTRVEPVDPEMGPRLTLLYALDASQGKRSIAIDLGKEEGRRILAQLIERSDVIAHNHLPRQAERLGFSAARVHELNPSAICCELSAFSGFRGGGWEHRPGYDPIVQAASGVMRRFGDPRRPAVHGIASTIDYFTGFSGALAMMVALLAREAGAVRLVARTSLARTAGWVQLPFCAGVREPPSSGQRALGPTALERIYRTRDGWVQLTVQPEAWPAVAGQLRGAPARPEDPALADWLAAKLRAHRCDAAVAWIRQAGGDAHKLLRARELAARPLAAETAPPPSALSAPSGRIIRVLHPTAGALRLPDATWMRFGHGVRRRLGPAPAPGEHTREVLSEAGLSAAEVDRLADAGTVAFGWHAGPEYLPR